MTTTDNPVTNSLSTNPARAIRVMAVLFAVVFFSGCNKPTVVQQEDGILVLGEFEESSSLQRGVSIGSRTLVIESETGSVTITGTSATEANLLFSVSARGESQSAALAQIDKLVIEESGDDATYTYNVIPDNDDLTTINVEGEIPRNASLRLVLRSGDITLTNVDGTIEVQQENGSIVFLGGSESVKLTTLNGDVFADFYRLTSGSRIDLNVANGDLSLGLPENANASVDARTRAGSVSVHDLRFEDQRLNRKGAGAVFTGKLGTGTAKAFLKTSNGSLTFNRVALSDLPPVESPMDDTDDAKAGEESDVMPDDSMSNDADVIETESPTEQSMETESEAAAEDSNTDDSNKPDSSGVEMPVEQINSSSSVDSVRSILNNAVDSDASATDSGIGSPVAITGNNPASR